MKRLTAAIAIAAIALSGLVATPAAALGKRDKQLLGAIAGAVTLGIILNELNDNGSSRRNTRPAPPRDNRDWNWEDRNRNDRVWRDDDKWRKDHRMTLPGACVMSVKTRQGRREVLGARCLKRKGLDRLPQSCAFDIRTDGGRSRVYGKSCLQGAGYRIGRR